MAKFRIDFKNLIKSIKELVRVRKTLYYKSQLIWYKFTLNEDSV